MTLNLATIPERHRERVLAAYERAREDAEIAAAYDEAVRLHGCVNAITELAEHFTQHFGCRISEARVRRAIWGK